MLRENILLSLQSILSHRLRSLLTMLGIIIGIASIITIVSTIEGTNEQLKSKLIGDGNNVTVISIGRSDDMYDSSLSAPEGILPCTEELRDQLTKHNDIKNAALFLKRNYSQNIFFRSTAYNGEFLGVDSHYFSTYGYKLINGRVFTEEDFTAFHKNAIVDANVAGYLFEGDDPIGQTLEIGGEAFTVIGIVSNSDSTKMNIETLSDYYLYSQRSTGKIFIPIDCWPMVYQFDEPPSIAVQATSTNAITSAGTYAAKFLNEKLVTGDTYSYVAKELQEQAEQIQQFTSSTNTQLIWIAAISLLVGGIGVMNIMLVSVTERTREIGLKKALGAKKKRILLQFLTEAGVLTALGGFIGVLAGIGLSFLLSAIMETPISISLPACLISLIFSAIIGTVFGLLPAMKAANMNPIDALRQE